MHDNKGNPKVYHRFASLPNHVSAASLYACTKSKAPLLTDLHKSKSVSGTSTKMQSLLSGVQYFDQTPSLPREVFRQIQSKNPSKVQMRLVNCINPPVQADKFNFPIRSSHSLTTSRCLTADASALGLCLR